MNDLLSMLKKEESDLIRMIYVISEQRKKEYPNNYDKPLANIRIARKGKSCQFFLYDEQHKRSGGTYLKKSEHELAKSLIKTNYNDKALEVCERRLKTVRAAVKIYEKPGLRELYAKLPGIKKKIISPFEIDDQTFREQWEATEYERKETYEESRIIATIKGDKVRSKSEAIIADRLFRADIPYRYEFPVELYGYGKVFPDFTILDMKTRKEIILEHLGMMDNEVYAQKAFKKIALYEKNGFVIGKNIIFTYETSRDPFNGRVFEQFLKNYNLI